MAALRVSSALACSYSSSFHSYPSVFTKFQSSPIWSFSISVTPLCSRRAKRMAHSIARDTLGLTQPNQSDEPKVILVLFLQKDLIFIGFLFFCIELIYIFVCGVSILDL